VAANLLNKTETVRTAGQLDFFRSVRKLVILEILHRKKGATPIQALYKKRAFGFLTLHSISLIHDVNMESHYQEKIFKKYFTSLRVLLRV